MSGGCRQCFNKNIQDRDIYPQTPFAKKETDTDRPPRRVGKKVLREIFENGPYGFIQTREDLMKYLEDNPNDHNDYVLEFVQRDTLFPKKRGELPVDHYSYHHVIPLHAKGSPDKWNIIYVTKKEHDKIHRLRYLIYRDPNDQKATYGTLSDLLRVSDSMSSSEVSFEESAKAKEAMKQENRRQATLQRRTPETLKAISEGMLWKHSNGAQVIIEPHSIETVKGIKALLINSLPEKSTDRQRMISNESSCHTYIREHIHTVFKIENSKTIVKKPRSSVYGFKVQSLKSIPKP